MYSIIEDKIEEYLSKLTHHNLFLGYNNNLPSKLLVNKVDHVVWMR